MADFCQWPIFRIYIPVRDIPLTIALNVGGSEYFGEYISLLLLRIEWIFQPMASHVSD
jgi:hypothetical protein